jgi:2-desacetyl-2-hydroxyethyl bacteriochlorophyllide A dehydrogenase
MMKSKAIVFIAPKELAIREEFLTPPAAGQLLVQARLSGISAGTEMLVYRGEFPQDLAVDASISSLAGRFTYPLKYGYAAVGEVIAAGPGVEPGWLGKRVFAFQPHASHFLAAPEELQPLPEDLPLEDAVFLPNMETAVNFLLDGVPLLGEQVAVLGQGIVGLLTTALLASTPIARLVSLDRLPLRRQTSLELGAEASLDPTDPAAAERARVFLQGTSSYAGADLVYELSGAPEALNQAIQIAGYSGRVVIGSWYGRKRAPIDLGGRFHRERIRLISSQVSSLAPEHLGRWDKARRFQAAWEWLRKLHPARLITHRFPLHRADEAYALLDKHPEETLQVIFTY